MTSEQLSNTNHPLRILLVEDDNHIGRIIELALPELKIPYEFVSVLSAEEGLRLWQEQPFDLLLTDYNLRGMTGLRLVETLKEEEGATAPMVLVTAYDSAELRREAAPLVDHYMTKPFFMDELIETVRRLLPAMHARELNG